MHSRFVKPENALKRAQEFLEVGHREEALNALRGVITSKRHRTWQKSHEALMLKYINLCVELRRGKEAKDGLHQYRGICQQANIASLGVVIKAFLEQAEQQAKGAQEKAEKITLNIEDLESEETSTEGLVEAKDRTDRALVTPWLKFLWEAYRTVLDILRNNHKLEKLYQETCMKAFEFCEKYKRFTEFKRLSEILRTHLVNISKYSHQTNAISLSNAESLLLHMEIRFKQLNVASNLELWQEAFRTAEDIHGLMTFSKKAPEPELMATYYEKLTQIFWVAKNYLLHSFAWFKHYMVLRTSGAADEERLRAMASAVLVSALSIPPDTAKPHESFLDMDDGQQEKTARLAALLGPTFTPQRDVLLSELVARNLPAHVFPELRDLYHEMEEKFHPLEFSRSVSSTLEFIGSHELLQKYREPLERVLFVRLLQQLSQVYQTVQLKKLAELAPFVQGPELERSLVEIVHKRYVDARLDHQKGALHFGGQTLESDQLRSQLTNLGRNLQVVVDRVKPQDPVEQLQKRQALFQRVLRNLAKENQRILERKRIIEKRKEIKEQLAKLRAKAAEEAARKEEEARKAKEAQIKEREAKLREEEKKKAVAKEQTTKEVHEQLVALQQSSTKHASLAQSLLRKLENEQVDAQEILKEKQRKINKAQKEMEHKITNLAKRMDHLERALREEEQPLLRAAFDKQQEAHRALYEEQRQQFHKTQEAAHIKKLEEKRRLSKMQPYRKAFEEELMKRRQAVYEVAKAEQDKRLVEIRAKLAVAQEKRRQEEEARRQQQEKHRSEQQDRAREREAEEQQRAEAEEQQREEQSRREEELRRAEEQRVEEERLQKIKRMEEKRRLLREQEEAKRRAAGGMPPERERESEREEGPPLRRPPSARAEAEGWRRGPSPTREEPEEERRWERRPPAARRGDEYRPPVGRDRDEYRPPVGRDREEYRPPRGGRDREEYRTPAGRDRDEYRPPVGRDRERERDREEYRPPVGRDREEYRPPAGREREEYRPPAGREREEYRPPVRRGAGPRDEWRDDRDRRGGPPTRGGDEWRRGGAGGPPSRGGDEGRGRGDREPSGEEDDGWSTVKRGRGAPRQ
ncbi:Eukaryotic translation initiation factor 3 subunit A [Balamuthia mandrillaris]